MFWDTLWEYSYYHIISTLLLDSKSFGFETLLQQDTHLKPFEILARNIFLGMCKRRLLPGRPILTEMQIATEVSTDSSKWRIISAAAN